MSSFPFLRWWTRTFLPVIKTHFMHTDFFIVRGHDESITTFTDINPVLLFTWNKNIKRLKWRYIVFKYTDTKKQAYEVARSMKWPSVSLISGPFGRKTFLKRDSKRWFIAGFTCMHVHTLIKLLNLIWKQILPGALILPAKCVWSKAAKILILYPGSGDFSRP